VSSVSRIALTQLNAGQHINSSARQESPPKRFTHYTAPFLQFGLLLFASVIIGVLLLAWMERDEGYLTAESGVGYWLGIVGAIVMLMLLAYPLRKRFRIFHGLGRVANWFRLHMIMGIIGPTVVILHTNFKLGSLNSRLALVTMLIVVASGIIGRYLYAKIHKGLYGKQIALRDVLSDLEAIIRDLTGKLDDQSSLPRHLQRYVHRSGEGSSSMLASFLFAASAGIRARLAYRQCRREVALHISTRADHSRLTRRARRLEMREIDNRLRTFFVVAKRADRLAFFERLFGMWHHLHMPLFVLLIMAVAIHVVAVHRY
jgi:hypothetical protein